MRDYPFIVGPFFWEWPHIGAFTLPIHSLHAHFEMLFSGMNIMLKLLVSAIS